MEAKIGTAVTRPDKTRPNDEDDPPTGDAAKGKEGVPSLVQLPGSTDVGPGMTLVRRPPQDFVPSGLPGEWGEVPLTLVTPVFRHGNKSPSRPPYGGGGGGV